jgi:hypothetical protein
MSPWTETLPTEYGRYYWHRYSPADEPVMVRVVVSYGRLRAGPWSGGLEDVSKMGGWWLAVEAP